MQFNFHKIISLLILLIVCTMLYGQNEKGYVGVSIGPTFPLKYFADNNINNANAGFAKTGLNINAFAIFKILKELGIIALIRVQNNQVDFDALNAQLQTQFSNKGANGWRVDGFMLGVLGSFGSIDLIVFEPKVMIGIMNTSTPSFKSNSVEYFASSAFSIAEIIGAGIRFKINDKVFFLINADFLNTKCRSQKISTFNLELGLAFKI